MESVTDKELEALEKQIEEKAKEPAPQPEPDQPEPAAKAIEPAPSSPDPVTTAPETSDPSKEVAEIMKKKGWKSPEDAIKAYAELEKNFHKERQPKDNPPYVPPPSYVPPVNPYAPPVYAPPPTPAYVQPSYIPPPPPYAPQPSITPPPMGSYAEEQLAASYQMTVEDFRKIFPMINDMTEVKNRKVETEFSRWRDELTRGSEKNEDRINVLSDPAFHNSDVQDVMHEFFKNNPQVFNERRPYSIALDNALKTIGRRNITRGSQANPASVPTEPPKTAGSSNGFSGKKQVMPAADFKKLSLEEQEKVLRQSNAFKTYEDLA